MGEKGKTLIHKETKEKKHSQLKNNPNVETHSSILALKQCPTKAMEINYFRPALKKLDKKAINSKRGN